MITFLILAQWGMVACEASSLAWYSTTPHPIPSLLAVNVVALAYCLTLALKNTIGEHR